MSRVSQGLAADPNATAITALTDSTGGSAGNTVNDTTASVKDDIASLAAKINEIISILQATGIAA